jgi:1,4-dihydroxy-2-naphthoate octaprenyltransferase
MTSLDTWVKGGRPRTLAAAIAPVIVGTALAGTHAMFARAALALIVSLSLQIGVNYSNDYSDGVRGTDSDRVGPIRIVASGLATPAAVRKAAFIAFSLAGIAGIALAALSSWWLLIVGALAILAAWTYTGGKTPYGYQGFGEISVFTFFGLVATMGTYYVQTQTLTLKSLAAAIPIGALSCAILAINNIRDRVKDALVGKRTLAVYLGENGSRNFFVLLLLLAHVAAIFVTPWALITLAALPFSLQLAREVKGEMESAALIPMIAKTGQLQLLFSALLATAILVS